MSMLTQPAASPCLRTQKAAEFLRTTDRTRQRGRHAGGGPTFVKIGRLSPLRPRRHGLSSSGTGTPRAYPAQVAGGVVDFDAFLKLDIGVMQSSLWPDLAPHNVFLTALMAKPFTLRENSPQLKITGLEPTGWNVPAGEYGFVAAASRR